MEPPASGWSPLGGNPTSRDAAHAEGVTPVLVAWVSSDISTRPICDRETGPPRRVGYGRRREPYRRVGSSPTRACRPAVPTWRSAFPCLRATMPTSRPAPPHEAGRRDGTPSVRMVPLGGNPTSRDVAHARRRHAGPGCVGVKRHPALGHLAIGEPGHRAEWGTGGDGNHAGGWGRRRRGPAARPRCVSPDIINRLA